MLGISIGEFFMVLLVAIAVIRPNDISDIAKVYKDLTKNFNKLKIQITSNFSQLHNEIIDIGTSDKVRDVEDDNHHYILDNDGKLQKAYTIKKEDCKETL